MIDRYLYLPTNVGTSRFQFNPMLVLCRGETHTSMIHYVNQNAAPLMKPVNCWHTAFFRFFMSPAAGGSKLTHIKL